jgi:gliding motility-associated-like protein
LRIFKISVFLTIFLLFSITALQAQLIVKTNRTVSDLVNNVLAGGGVDIKNIQYSVGTGNIGFFNGKKSNIGLDSGIVLSTGKVTDAIGPNDIGNKGSSNNLPGDADLQLLSPNFPTYDATWITFTFTPQANQVKFRFVFASEEYPENINKNYNDVFGFFITGPGFTGNQNIALIPSTTDPISIQTINANTNSSYYIDNSNGTSIQFDAFTKVIEINATVQPCKSYTLKFAIADVKDFIYDSGIFIEAQSFQSADPRSIIAYEQKKMVSECDSAGFVLTRINKDKSQAITVNYIFEGTAINGVDYTATPANKVIIPAGSTSAFVKIKPTRDFLNEANESVKIKIVDPVICDTAQADLSISDYKPIDKLKFQLACNDSTTTVAVVQYDQLDSIKWYNQDKLFLQYGNSFTVKNNDTTIHYVYSIEKCTGLTIKDSVKLKAYPITTNKDTTVCIGDVIQLFATSNFPNAKYSWTSNVGLFSPSTEVANPMFTVLDSSIVTVKINSDQICSQKTFKIFAPELRIKDSVNSICKNGSVTLIASGGKKYKWIPSYGLSSDTISSPIASPDTSMKYELTITNGICEKKYNVTVKVDTIPHANAGLDHIICTRQTVRLNGSGSDYESYLWFPTLAVDSPSNPNPLANPAQTTQYVLQAFNGSCFSFDTVNIFVVDSVNAAFNYVFDSCARTIFVTPIANLNNSNFIWDFGDGFQNSITTQTHQYQQKGTYVVKLVTNSLAPCKSEDSLVLTIPFVDKTLRRITDVFSPDDDQMNDEFEISGETSPCAIKRMRIFNRWGETIYDSIENQGKLVWDGKYKGSPCPIGAYIYYVEGDGFIDKGTISLVR